MFTPPQTIGGDVLVIAKRTFFEKSPRKCLQTLGGGLEGGHFLRKGEAHQGASGLGPGGVERARRNRRDADLSGQPSGEVLVAELREACQGQRVLILSSNGVLRYFLESVEGAFEAALAERTFKLKTGRGGRLVPGEAVLAWNAKPHALLGLEAPA